MKPVRALSAVGGARVAIVQSAAFALFCAASFGSSQALALAFVQVNAATPQTAQSTVTVGYANAQVAGNTNVIVVGWNDNVATVVSVGDTHGNSYLRAVGPTASGAQTQSIYYATSIAGGANSVTVSFSQAAQFTDIRIVEYSGIDAANPIDTVAGAAGSGSPSASGFAITANGNDLLFGANTVAQTTTGPGSGFTSRLITVPDSDIVEDQTVTVNGSYQATAPVNAGDWVMQLVGFRAVGAGPPTVPGAPTDVAAVAGDGSALVTWVAPSSGGSPITGYTTTSTPGNLSTSGNGAATSASVGGLTNGTAYAFQVVASNTIGNGPPSTATAPVTPSVTTTAAFPVVYSTDKRFLQDINGVPFPILGRTAWFMTSLAAVDYRALIDDSVARGYNSIEFHVINHDSRGNHAPFDGSGRAPFTQRLDGAPWSGTLAYSNNNQNPDFTTPNEAYWQEIDAVLAYAESKGVLLFMFPAYVGYPNTDQGWMNELLANGATRMHTYGAWIANRYRNQKNLVWMMGGDRNFGDPAQAAVETGLLQGIQSVTTLSRYFSAEWNSDSIGTDEATFGSAMTLNSVYSWGGDISNHGRRAYSHTPVEPAFLLEEPYDEEGGDGNGVNPSATQPVRRFQWWGWLSTSGGYISGNGYVWPFVGAWRSHLDTQGARDMARLNALIKSIPWWQLVPSGLNGMRTLVTVGNVGVSNPGYVAAAANPSGTLLIAYIPPAHAGSITIDMTAMSADSLARWFNPTTGAYTTIGNFAPISTHTFVPPGNNGSGYSDWVLLLTLTQADAIFTNGFE